MKTILINLNSIKHNPNAGATSTFVGGTWTIYFNCVGKLPLFFKDGENCRITEIDNDKHSGIILDPALLDKCINEEVKGIKISMDRNVQEINHFPISAYNYKYINTKLRCKYCKKLIMSNDLKCDGEDDGYNEKICPECGAWECVDIQYENIHDALERKESVKKINVIKETNLLK